MEPPRRRRGGVTASSASRRATREGCEGHGHQPQRSVVRSVLHPVGTARDERQLELPASCLTEEGYLSPAIASDWMLPAPFTDRPRTSLPLGVGCLGRRDEKTDRDSSRHLGPSPLGQRQPSTNGPFLARLSRTADCPEVT